MKDLNVKVIPLVELKVGKDNVRCNIKIDDVNDLAKSIKSVGLINPLTVRKDGDTYNVIAGRRRLHALKILCKDDESFNAANCILVGGNKKLDSLKSLAENVHVHSMNAFERYEAFILMKNNGNSFTKIANTFGVSVHNVKQYIQLGNASEKVKVLYFDDTLDDDDIKFLSRFSKEKQDGFCEHIEDMHYFNHNTLSSFFQIDSIDAEVCLFDVKESGIAVSKDLFEENTWIADIPLFWKLQKEEIFKMCDDLKKESKKVKFFDIDEEFNSWHHDRGDEGCTVLDFSNDGSLDVYDDIIFDVDEDVNDDDLDSDEQGVDNNALPNSGTKRQELTAKAQMYYSDHHYQFVRNELHHDDNKSFRLFVAHLVHNSVCGMVFNTGVNNMSFESEQLTDNDDLAEINERIKSLITFFDGNIESLKFNKFVDFGVSVFDVYKMIEEKTNDELIHICSTLQLLILRKDTDLIEKLGVDYEIDVTKSWRCDDETVDTFTSKDSTLNIASNFITTANIPGFSNLSLKDRRMVLKTKVKEYEDTKNETFVPKYMQFPVSYYAEVKLDIAKFD